MDGKYLSDLLNVSMNKEKLMKQILESKQQGENMKQQMTVSIRDQKSRCHLLGRSDLLPLILCVSQRRYMRRLEAEEEMYSYADILEYFFAEK